MDTSNRRYCEVLYFLSGPPYKVHAEWIELTPDDPKYELQVMRQLVRDVNGSNRKYSARWYMKVVRGAFPGSEQDSAKREYDRMLERGGTRQYPKIPHTGR